IPFVLLLTAEDVNSGSDLRTFADDGFPQHAIASDVNAASHRRCPVDKKRTKLNAAFQGAFLQCQTVVRDSQVVTGKARSESATLGPNPVQPCDAPETAGQRQRKGKRQKYGFCQLLQDRLQIPL